MLLKTKHKIDVARIETRLPRYERGIAVELDTGERDRRLILRRGHDSIQLAGKGRLNGRTGRRQRRSTTCGTCATEADIGHFGTWAGKQRYGGIGRCRIADPFDQADIRVDSAGFRVAGNHGRVAEENRPAQGADARVECGFQTDFGANAGGITGGDGNNWARAVRHEVAEFPKCYGEPVYAFDSKVVAKIASMNIQNNFPARAGIRAHPYSHRMRRIGKI